MTVPLLSSLPTPPTSLYPMPHPLHRKGKASNRETTKYGI